jgi:probable phosphoglycerate mutase
MIKLIITRHGKTKENADGVIQGKDHGNINEEGYKQISKLIERLKKEKINLIISSDILRCDKTVQEIIKQIKIPVIYSELIREKNNGDWVGKNHKEIDWSILGNDFENRKAPNGESLTDVRERGRKFFKEFLEEYKDKNILVVSHGAFLKVFIGDLLHMSLYDSIFKLKIDHCSLTFIDIKNKEDYNVKTINSTDFL